MSAKAAREGSRKAAARTVERIRSNITRSGRVRTGRMRDSVNARQQPDGSYLVGSDLHYFDHQELGTRGSVARPGSFLVFRGRGGQLVFAKKVRGISPGRFLRDAVRRLSPDDFAT